MYMKSSRYIIVIRSSKIRSIIEMMQVWKSIKTIFMDALEKYLLSSLRFNIATISMKLKIDTILFCEL